jgi:hypothetical protein
MSSERNRVSPYCSRKGRKAARLDNSDAGRGGESKPMLSGNRMDTDSRIWRESELTSLWSSITKEPD